MDRTRWTLASLLAACDWLAPLSPSGLHHLFDRLQISYQRAREWVRSPDPRYDAKRRAVTRLLDEARQSDGRMVALFQDELTYYRQPTLARAYEAHGCQPRARRSHRSNTPTRVAATLDALTARVLFWQGARFGIAEIVRFYRHVAASYPQAARIYLIQDNWPVHFHPDVLVALEEQECPWPWIRPAKWPEEPSAAACRKWSGLSLPIQLVPLPTYASWLNPTEKLWRKGKQDVLHLHPLAERLPALRQEFVRFLEQFADGSSELLRYVGLETPG